MNNGWIKIHRKLLDNPIILKPDLLQVFIYCLLKANHESNEFIFNNELIKVERGSFITGRIEMSKALKRSESAIYRNLKLLRKFNYISLKSNNKFTILTVIKYNTYQIKELISEQQVNNKRTTTEQQLDTNKNDKNDKNDKKKDLCLFKNSEFYDFPQFKVAFLANEKYAGYDVNYYYESVKNWSAGKGAMKKDWIATAHNFALGDKNPRFSKNGNVETIKLPD